MCEGELFTNLINCFRGAGNSEDFTKSKSSNRQHFFFFLIPLSLGSGRLERTSRNTLHLVLVLMPCPHVPLWIYLIQPACLRMYPPKQLLPWYTLQAVQAETNTSPKSPLPRGEGKITTPTSAPAVSAASFLSWLFRESTLPFSQPVALNARLNADTWADYQSYPLIKVSEGDLEGKYTAIEADAPIADRLSAHSQQTAHAAYLQAPGSHRPLNSARTKLFPVNHNR